VFNGIQDQSFFFSDLLRGARTASHPYPIDPSIPLHQRNRLAHSFERIRAAKKRNRRAHHKLAHHNEAAPSDYNRERKAAWNKLTAAVEKAYKDVDENPELLNSGVSKIQRQQLAVAVAKMMYATQSAILESDFPSGAQASH